MRCETGRGSGDVHAAGEAAYVAASGGSGHVGACIPKAGPTSHAPKKFSNPSTTPLGVLWAQQLTGAATYGHSALWAQQNAARTTSGRRTVLQGHKPSRSWFELGGSGGGGGNRTRVLRRRVRASPGAACSLFLGPTGPAGRPVWAQSLFDVPRYPVTGWRGDPPSDARSWAGGAPRLTVTYISSGREGVTGGNRLRLVGSYFLSGSLAR